MRQGKEWTRKELLAKVREEWIKSYQQYWKENNQQDMNDFVNGLIADLSRRMSNEELLTEVNLYEETK